MDAATKELESLRGLRDDVTEAERGLRQCTRNAIEQTPAPHDDGHGGGYDFARGVLVRVQVAEDMATSQVG